MFDSVPKEYGLLAIISTMSWGLGYFGMPQVLVRFMGIRSDTEVKHIPPHRNRVGNRLDVLRR